MLKNLIERLTCPHRHDINSHPQCFAVGNVNESKAEKLYDITGKYWYNLDGLRIGYFDIEVDNFEADFGAMLAWSVKEKGGDVAFDKITKEELFNGAGDRRIVESLLKELSKYKIIVSYYGSRMDVPWIRTKALRYGLKFPTFMAEEHNLKNGETRTRLVPELYHFDLYYTVKYKFALSSNSMANACDYFGLDGKQYVSKEFWRRAKYGDPEAVEAISQHNIQDVIMLEQLHDKVEPFVKFSRKGV